MRFTTSTRRPSTSSRSSGAANYEKLRLATAKPNEVPWHLPESIDFKRLPTDPLWERHLYVEGNGQFRAELGNWEAGVLKEELAKPKWSAGCAIWIASRGRWNSV
jgi:hypothetical protein